MDDKQLAGLGRYSGPATLILSSLAAGAGEPVSHDVLPGKTVLDELDGACSVPVQVLDVAAVGPSRSGAFYSRARHRSVGYTLAFPPGHAMGSNVSLVVMLLCVAATTKTHWSGCPHSRPSPSGSGGAHSHRWLW
jgi:hypothetical protein